MPAGPGVRVDTAVEAGERVPPDYDPLIAKIIVVAADRGAAIDRLRRALDEAAIGGIQTTLPFHRFVARHAGFAAGDLSIDWVADHWDGEIDRGRALARALLAAGLVARDGVLDPPAVPAAPGRDGHDLADPWVTEGRELGVDRWPR
jgi:acetyl/propionyl-CoA carboxylase alpha subunit